MTSHSLSHRTVSIQTMHASRPSIHPGWYSPVLAPEEEPVETPPEVLFEVFTEILKIAGALDRSASEALEDLRLTAGAFTALVELGKIGDAGVAPSELARRLSVARRTATLYVDILTRQGWAVREAHPGDRRMVLARLSDAGKRLLEEDGERYQRRLAELLGDISPAQAERLRQLLGLIVTDRRS
ncbi:MAG TPA: MarR family transcriptional regulator [Thermomicrobiales bacterium]|nr:MarR family transcriptional regulator [Thermomicrobiales bacterium]